MMMDVNVPDACCAGINVSVRQVGVSGRAGVFGGHHDACRDCVRGREEF
jgi:hypothetical protein